MHKLQVVRMVKWSKNPKILDSWNVIFRAKSMLGQDSWLAPLVPDIFKNRKLQSLGVQVIGLESRYSEVQPSSLPFVPHPQLEIEFRLRVGNARRGAGPLHVVCPLFPLPQGLQGTLGY